MEPGTAPRVHSSEDSDVFICEDAVGTPAPESDAVSVFPAETSGHTRTQHGRAAVGVEASVVYNDWDTGMLNCICFVHLSSLPWFCSCLAGFRLASVSFTVGNMCCFCY